MVEIETHRADRNELIKMMDVDVDENSEQSRHDLLDTGSIIFWKRDTYKRTKFIIKTIHSCSNPLTTCSVNNNMHREQHTSWLTTSILNDMQHKRQQFTRLYERTDSEREELLVVDLILHPFHQQFGILRGWQFGWLLVFDTITPVIFVPRKNTEHIQKSVPKKCWFDEVGCLCCWEAAGQPISWKNRH